VRGMTWPEWWLWWWWSYGEVAIRRAVFVGCSAMSRLHSAAKLRSYPVQRPLPATCATTSTVYRQQGSALDTACTRIIAIAEAYRYPRRRHPRRHACDGRYQWSGLSVTARGACHHTRVDKSRCLISLNCSQLSRETQVQRPRRSV
jgi:hypothetical protein